MWEMLAKVEANTITMDEFQSLIWEYRAPSKDKDASQRFQQDFIEFKDRTRLMREEIERRRRQGILDGECDEHGSHKWIKEQLEHDQEEMATFYKIYTVIKNNLSGVNEA